MLGVLNDAILLYFADATLASAFVARWCVGSKFETAGGVFQVRDIQQSYQRKIEAAPSDKQRLTIEANDSMAKAVTDQGLSLDEYNSIISTAQNDPVVRKKLTQRMRRSGQ